ncbi:MAG: hypothetical protein K2N36_08370, partial [Ruminiclostridium sp.]|nr:hypothetical protein [Ruminiclostridium sp.]
MDFKEFKQSILDYFDRTEIPDDLEPDKVFSFVKPKAVEKKAVEAVRPEKKAPAPEPKKEAPKPEPAPKAEEKEEIKPEKHVWKKYVRPSLDL